MKFSTPGMHRRVILNDILRGKLRVYICHLSVWKFSEADRTFLLQILDTLVQVAVRSNCINHIHQCDLPFERWIVQKCYYILRPLPTHQISLNQDWTYSRLKSYITTCIYIFRYLLSFIFIRYSSWYFLKYVHVNCTAKNSDFSLINTSFAS